MQLKFRIIVFFALALVFTSCEKDPVIENEEEVITTLIYTLTPTAGGDATVLRFQDLDGDGGNAPTIEGGTLTANTTYTGVLELLNEQESPAEDITEEVAEEDEEHQFFFETTVPSLSISYDDEDADGNPIGLRSNLSTGDAGSGTITVILRHEPNKTASGVADGDSSNAGGETDIEVTFDIDVQ